MKKILALWLLFFSLSGYVNAQTYLVGARGGSTFETDAGHFRQADAFVGRYLPWRWNSYFGLSFKPRVEASAGCLSGGDQDGFVGTLGPVIEMQEGKFPVTLEGGISLTGLSRYDFDDRDLGGQFQFTDHLGFDWHVSKGVTVGWRFQHMSNAGIYRHNPGLNLQMLSASYSF
jgi:hypothetical protein